MKNWFRLRFLVPVILALMALGVCGGAMADGDVASIGETPYTSLESALNVANDTSIFSSTTPVTIKILKLCTLTSNVEVNSNVTIVPGSPSVGISISDNVTLTNNGTISGIYFYDNGTLAGTGVFARCMFNGNNPANYGIVASITADGSTYSFTDLKTAIDYTTGATDEVTIKVLADCKLSSDVTVSKNVTVISDPASNIITIERDKKLTNNGQFLNFNIDGDGKVAGTGDFYFCGFVGEPANYGIVASVVADDGHIHYFADLKAAIDCVNDTGYNETVTILADCTLSSDVTVGENVTVASALASNIIIIDDGKKLTNNGNISGVNISGGTVAGTGVFSGCGMGTNVQGVVASITYNGTTYSFADLKAAIDYTKSMTGDITVNVTAACTLSDDVTVGAKVTVIGNTNEYKKLYLNGHTLTNNGTVSGFTIVAPGNLTGTGVLTYCITMGDVKGWIAYTQNGTNFRYYADLPTAIKYADDTNTKNPSSNVTVNITANCTLSQGFTSIRGTGISIDENVTLTLSGSTDLAGFSISGAGKLTGTGTLTYCNFVGDPTNYGIVAYAVGIQAHFADPKTAIETSASGGINLLADCTLSENATVNYSITSDPSNMKTLTILQGVTLTNDYDVENIKISGEGTLAGTGIFNECQFDGDNPVAYGVVASATVDSDTFHFVDLTSAIKWASDAFAPVTLLKNVTLDGSDKLRLPAFELEGNYTLTFNLPVELHYDDGTPFSTGDSTNVIVKDMLILDCDVSGAKIKLSNGGYIEFGHDTKFTDVNAITLDVSGITSTRRIFKFNDYAGTEAIEMLLDNGYLAFTGTGTSGGYTRTIDYREDGVYVVATPYSSVIDIYLNLYDTSCLYDGTPRSCIVSTNLPADKYTLTYYLASDPKTPLGYVPVIPGEYIVTVTAKGEATSLNTAYDINQTATLSIQDPQGNYKPEPTATPEITAMPTGEPTATPEPTAAPTATATATAQPTFAPTAAPTTAPTDQSRDAWVKTGNTYSKLNMRDSANGALVATLKYGTKVTVHFIENGWASITASGKDGWVLEKYLTYSNPETGDEESTEYCYAVTMQSAGSKLNLRARASTSSTVLARLARGVVLDVNGTAGGWVNVSYSGSNGYVSASYVKLFKTRAEADELAGAIK